VVLVDSSIWIEALRRDGDVMVKLALKGLLGEMEAASCSMVKLEVMGGARKDERKRLEGYFEVVPYIPVTERAGPPLCCYPGSCGKGPRGEVE